MARGRLSSPIASEEGGGIHQLQPHGFRFKQRQHHMAATKDQSTGAVEHISQRQRTIAGRSCQHRQGHQQGNEGCKRTRG